MDDRQREKIQKRLEEESRQSGMRISRVQMEKILEALEKKEEGIPLKESLGFSAELLQSIYEFACRLGQGGEYETAYYAYHLLLQVDDPNDVRYLQGKATASFMLQYYQEAINLFLACYMREPKNLGHLWYAIEASKEQGSDLVTMGLLKTFLENSEGISGYDADRERGKLMYERLQQKLNELLTLAKDSEALVKGVEAKE
jgi:tetratricopeptide (TPR) repeat protein